MSVSFEHCERVPRELCRDLITRVHYANRWPSISFSYGLFRGGSLEGICTFGQPASPYLCVGVCGKKWKSSVLELNRLCLYRNKRNDASRLVGASLRMLREDTSEPLFEDGSHDPVGRIVVSYADSAQGHSGKVYQATNFIFTGTTKERTDIDAGGAHPRHHNGDATKRVCRSAKHRYVFFVGNSAFRKQARRDLKYKPQDYPQSPTNKRQL